MQKSCVSLWLHVCLEPLSYSSWLLQREGLDSEYTVTSSSGYSNSSEVKARMSEVWRLPGNGFSLCTAPTFCHVHGISNGGYKLSFRNAPERKLHTGTIPSMNKKTRDVEVRSSYSSEVRGMCEVELVYRKSRVGQDKYKSSSSSIFRMRKHT